VFVGQCAFGRAWVDTPLGDLDGSGRITGPSVEVLTNSQLYPYGTTELFPNMLDTQNNVLDNTAHSYVECSNKGYCNRVLGQCACLYGYEGSACQRTVCPTIDAGMVCSGHGVCESARKIAAMDFSNIYRQWDEDMTMGCVCDPGYTGADCNQKVCKYGYDPNFVDKSGSWRYTNWSFVMYTATSAPVTGNYSLLFTDRTGMEWHTTPLDFNTSCKDIVTALESLPNRAVPSGSTLCVKWNNYNTIKAADEPGYISSNPYYGIKYNLAFPKNPGILKPLAINTHLDGNRATISATDGSSVSSFVYANGFYGEYIDYFRSLCQGVDVTLQAASTYNYLGGLTNLELRLLQQCLGQVNMGVTAAITGSVKGQTYLWDYGTALNPHLVKLVDISASHVTDMCPGSVDSVRGGGTACVMKKAPGFIVPLYYDTTLSQFVLMTRPAGDYSSTTLFSIWFTDGFTQLISPNVKVYTDTSEPYSHTVYTTNSTVLSAKYTGGVDCETSLTNHYGLLDCVDKGQIIFLLDTSHFSYNPKYMNLYEIKKIYNADLNRQPLGAGIHRIVLNMPINAYWRQSDATAAVRIFKFIPRTSYPYVAECSNRGLCDRTNGYCKCFVGYQRDDCSSIDNSDLVD
jgi:hypothetical protein